MILTIDTERELTSTDLELLRALLRQNEPAQAAPAAPTSSASAPERIWERIQQSPDVAARRPAGAVASAKLPISSQPGVSSVESTRDPDQENPDPQPYDAGKPATEG